MAKHTDPNGAIWEITPAAASWVASPADESDTGYINTFDDIQGNRTMGGGEVHLTWPFNKEPSLIGKFAEVKPEAAIDSFARTNKAKATIRVQGKGPGADNGSLIALIVIGAIVYLSDKRR